MIDTGILVVGAGPVGLTLAIALGRRGVDVTLIERKKQAAFLPKMERTNARSMEMYRRLGIADRIRAASEFTPIPMDVFVLTAYNQPPVLHLEYPSALAAKKEIEECHDGTLPLEPYQLISQYTLEPLLRTVAEEIASVDVHFGTKLESFEQDDESVSAVATTDSGEKRVRARYLVGCDGGRSTVRRILGIELEGEADIRTMQRLFFRSDALFDRITVGQGRHYQLPECGMVVQDDLKHFMVNFYQADDTLDPVERFKEVAGIDDFDIEVHDETPWSMNLMVADSYRKGRAFIAGDAAHLVIPHGGLGMNTGVGDAVDLAWKLTGTLEGWAGPGLLDSYEAERRQIGLRNVDASRSATSGALGWRSVCGPHYREDSPKGVETRASVRRLASWGQKDAYEMHGIELGYRYTNSPIIWYDNEVGEGPDPDSRIDYVPTTWPGARLPHMWLNDGSAIQDRLGDRFTLLALTDNHKDTSDLKDAFDAFGAPLEVITLAEPHLREVYERDLILVRPDLHVVWRGDEPPEHPEQLAACSVGHLSGQ